MARPAPPERNRAARSFRQLRRFHHVINSDKVFGIQTVSKLLLVSARHEAGDIFDMRERGVLAWTETVTDVARTGVPDDAYAAAFAIFSEKELADLTVAVGVMGAYNRLAISFHVETPLDLAATLGFYRRAEQAR